MNFGARLGSSKPLSRRVKVVGIFAGTAFVGNAELIHLHTCKGSLRMSDCKRKPTPRSTSQFFRQELYQRMSDDLQITGKAPRTHNGYLRAVRQLAEFAKTQPDQITEAAPRRD